MSGRLCWQVGGQASWLGKARLLQGEVKAGLHRSWKRQAVNPHSGTRLMEGPAALAVRTHWTTGSLFPWGLFLFCGPLPYILAYMSQKGPLMGMTVTAPERPIMLARALRSSRDIAFPEQTL